MKRMLQRSLGAIVVIGMLCSLALSYFLQIKMIHRDVEEASKERFWQINQLLTENTIESRSVEEEFRETCLLKAKTAAYIIQSSRMAVYDQEEMKEIADLLEVDELHIFDAEGTIYAGSEPKYFGYSFQSGEQMRFFLPMLEDKSLELCQDVMPNTAEQKMMQYAAVWREDGEGIVQIGMEPSRLLRVMEKNELSYIFSLLAGGTGEELYAADPDTYEILGATDEALVGQTLMDIGFDEGEIYTKGKGFHAPVNGRMCYCMFSDLGSVLVGRVCTTESLYGKVNHNSLILVLCLLLISVIMIWSIFRYLDKNIIQGIEDVNHKLQNITDGNLDEVVDVRTIPELVKLSSHINQMVKSLLDTTDKLSSVLNMVQTPIGVYEYSHGMKRVRITDKIPKILELSRSEKEKLIENYVLFEKKLEEIRENPVDAEDTNVFCLCKDGTRYVKMESHIRDDSFFGILIDVTKDMEEKKQLEQERDEDLLTGLSNRRGFAAQLELLFEQQERLKYNALIMIDMDKLKQVNDNYGHDAGDCYLQDMAEILRSCRAPGKVAARLGGDEFAIFLYGCESSGELQAHIQELEQKQNGYVATFHGKLELAVQFSMGTAYCPADGMDYSTLLKCADERMYESKRLKKKRI